MNIETKYNIGDDIWRMKDNKAVGYRVMKMGVSISSRGDAPPMVSINYILGDNYQIMEDDAFPTKESLLQSL